MTTETLSRREIIDEIANCEARLIELRAMLPDVIKPFYRFRCRPEKYVWIYADSDELAEQKLVERMNRTYGDAWSRTSGVVNIFNDASIAANQARGNLLTYLTESDAREFLADWQVNQAGKTEDPNRPKHAPKGQLERDIESYELSLRQKEQS